MTLAQVEERLTALEQAVGRLTALEQAVERLQSLGKDGSNAFSPTREKRKEEDEEEWIPGTEYDLVVTVPPKESYLLEGRIVSIQVPPAELGLTEEEWALYGSEKKMGDP